LTWETKPMVEDADERARALEPDRSFLVEAPAGSGKTELLIQRYLRLLSLVDKPESVVAMTFTRKAAAEMNDRILAALHDAENKSSAASGQGRATRRLATAVLLQSRIKGWDVLKDPRQLQIQTIDSFCSMLTRQMPVLAGFGSNPDVVEHAEELYTLASRRTLTTLADNEEYRPVFRDSAVHFDGDLVRLEQQIAKMLMKRDQWMREIETCSPDTLYSEIKGLLDQSVMERLQMTWRLWPPEIPGRPTPVIEAIDDWRQAAEVKLTKKGEVLKRGRYALVLESHPQFCESLHECRNLATTINDENWRIIYNFVVTLRIALHCLEDVFRERAQVDFTRIAHAAVAGLGPPDRPTDLAMRLDYRIEHLLVDEFQDTSLIQYELLDRLTAQWSLDDGRTLFVVGDPMQSIYRFRDAEVGLFLRAAQYGVGGVKLEKLVLRSNFRSQPEIVEWVNRVFRQIAPAEDSIERGEVALRECTAGRSQRGPKPSIHAFVDDGGRQEARRVVEIVKKTVQKGTTAILVRSRSHLSAILPALREARISYEAIDIDALNTEQHILDLLSLTRALHFLADRLSWLACLRAPWCGLTLADLAALVEDAPKATLFELLSSPERISRLSPDGRLRATRFFQVAERAIENFGRYTLREVVEGMWTAIGGPAVLEHENHRKDVYCFLELVEELDNGGRIPDFTIFDQRLQFLFAKPDLTTPNSVQVMTIHAAKGLQFDTVIVPHLESPTHSLEPELLVFTERIRPDGSERVLMAGLPQAGEQDPFYKLVRRELRDKEDAEDCRLLYVAATRAKEELHLLGNVTSKSNQNGINKPRESFLRLLWEEAEPLFLKELERIQSSSSRQQLLPLTAESNAGLRRLPASWTLPQPEPSVSWQPKYRIETPSEREPSYIWVGETSRHVGTVVHDLLRRVAVEGLENWPISRVTGLSDFVAAELSRLGVCSSDHKSATERALRALETTLHSERGRWILSPHTKSQCEWALGGLLEDRLEAARIDRTFVDADGTRWIIDYKISTHEGTSRRSFLDEQKRRYQPQLEAYARLLEAAGEDKVSVGLYFPLLDEWIAWSVLLEQKVLDLTRS
jgi:ATP-dependent helicase/nuclease subunit A